MHLMRISGSQRCNESRKRISYCCRIISVQFTIYLVSMCILWHIGNDFFNILHLTYCRHKRYDAPLNSQPYINIEANFIFPNKTNTNIYHNILSIRISSKNKTILLFNCNIQYIIVYT